MKYKYINEIKRQYIAWDNFGKAWKKIYITSENKIFVDCRTDDHKSFPCQTEVLFNDPLGAMIDKNNAWVIEYLKKKGFKGFN